jgi:hypothetical protein
MREQGLLEDGFEKRYKNELPSTNVVTNDLRVVNEDSSPSASNSSSVDLEAGPTGLC